MTRNIVRPLRRLSLPRSHCHDSLLGLPDCPRLFVDAFIVASRECKATISPFYGVEWTTVQCYYKRFHCQRRGYFKYMRRRFQWKTKTKVDRSELNPHSKSAGQVYRPDIHACSWLAWELFLYEAGTTGMLPVLHWYNSPLVDGLTTVCGGLAAEYWECARVKIPNKNR